MTTKTDWLLIFTFSPVQGFISGAKKTRDLYAGSYFLSFLTRRVLEELKNQFGEKVEVIYPQADKVGKDDPYWGTIVGNYPNRFVVKVKNSTTEEVKEIVKTLKETFKTQFTELANNLKNILVWENLKNLHRCPENTHNVENLSAGMDQIDQQIGGYFQSFVAAVPLKGEYGEVYDIAERTLGGRKSWRRYEGEIDRNVYKTKDNACYFPDGCTSCGEHLHLAIDWKTFKKHLKQLKKQQKTSKDADKEITSVGEGEKLCALCLVKRELYKVRLGDYINGLSFDEELKNELKQAIERFPSTHDIALAKEKFELFERLKEIYTDEEKLKIYSQEGEPIEFFIWSLAKVINIFKDEGALSYGINRIYRKKIEELLKPLIEFAEKKPPEGIDVEKYKEDAKVAWQISAEYLSTDFVERLIKTLEEIKKEEETKKENSDKNLLKELEEKINALKEWLITLKNLYRGLKEATGEDFESKLNKTPYFAMVYSDGDNIGKILGGDFEFLEEGKTFSEEFHKEFSKKLSEYAYETAKEVEEPTDTKGVGFARVIYAGGDDLFAFLHPSEVIRTLKLTSENYKKHLQGIIKKEKATTSAGLVIGHAKVSLKYLHKKTKEAEGEAKKNFGRNAFVIKVISRSGEESSFGAKYSYGEFKTLDLLSKAVELYKNNKISSKLPYALREIADRFIPDEVENQKPKEKECEPQNPCKEKEEIADPLPFKIALTLLRRELNRKIDASQEDKEKIENFKREVEKFFQLQRNTHPNLTAKELLKNLAAMFYVARTLAEREAFTLSEEKK
ncbi:MAG: type III-B CRISPR-associated protein Cas10/Cmr2 [Aquificae bacterium]|nr:type III-B CRISPR-associated protein Cas10/Cmr2 [Aquificota bacterium]